MKKLPSLAATGGKGKRTLWGLCTLMVAQKAPAKAPKLLGVCRKFDYTVPRYAAIDHRTIYPLRILPIYSPVPSLARYVGIGFVSGSYRLPTSLPTLLYHTANLPP